MKKFAGDIIISQVYQKSQSYNVRFLRYGVRQTKNFVILGHFFIHTRVPYMKIIYGSRNIKCDRQKFLSFWAIFCPFSPLTTWKIKILTMKKTPGDIFTLHICTINNNHTMYGSWDMKRNRRNFLLLWIVFCPLLIQKIQILKKWKNYLQILSFYKCAP